VQPTCPLRDCLGITIDRGPAVRVEEVIRNQDIGFVQSGQDAEIKVDTFNFTR
jgi:hemolysin D